MKVIIKNSKYIFLTLLLIFFISNISIVFTSVKDASVLFFNKIFISIFPFIILSDILIYFDYHIFLKNTMGKILSRLFNIDPNVSIIFILSLLTSYPSNAIYIKNMLDKNEIDINTANKIINYTYFPSISFVIGTIGISIYNSFTFGLFLWICILIYNVFLGIFLRKNRIISNNYIADTESKGNFFTMIKKSILKGIDNSIIILGNLIIFTIIVNFIKTFIHTNSILSVSLIGSLEITNGILNINLLNTNIYIKFCLTLFILTFSSLSIIFQSRSILSNYNINIKKILILKLISSLIFVSLIYMLIVIIY